MHFLILAVITFLINIPAGYFRENFRKMSWQWFLTLHAPIPFIFILRRSFGYDYYVVPILILIAISGQLIGAKPIRRYIQANMKENQDSESL